MNFDSFDLYPQIVAGVQALGYSTPTPIQRQAIPPALKGQDVLGLAQTGTGKTAAFVLPILQRLAKRPRGRIGALVIAPTRELSDQINTTFEALGRQTRLRSLPIYGGVPMAPQVRDLRSGVEIIVACPGRLLDHIRRGRSGFQTWRCSCWTRRTGCWTWGFFPISGRSSSTCRPCARR